MSVLFRILTLSLPSILAIIAEDEFVILAFTPIRLLLSAISKNRTEPLPLLLPAPERLADGVVMLTVLPEGVLTLRFAAPRMSCPCCTVVRVFTPV